MPQDEQEVEGVRSSRAQWLYGRTGILLAGILVLGAAIRIPLVLGASVWYDEAVSIYYAQQPLHLLPGFLKRDVGEPLFFAILRGWMALFGNGERATAALPFVFSVANLYAIFMLGRKMFGDRVGLLSALLLAVNTVGLHNAANVRFYALLDLVATLSNLAFFSALENRKATKYFIGISIAGFYTHAYYYFVCFAQMTVVLLFHRQALRRMTLAWLWVGAAYAPWFLAVFVRQYLGNMGDVNFRQFTPIEALSVFGQTTWSKVVPCSVTAHGYILALAVVIGLQAYWAVRRLRHKGIKDENRRLMTLLALYTVAIGTPILISIFKPIYLPGRYDVIGLSVLLASAAYGICKGLTWVKRPWVAGVLCLAIAAMSAPHIRWRLTDKLDGDRTAIGALRTDFAADDTVLFVGYSGMAAQYYMDQYRMRPKNVFSFPRDLSPLR